jgi:hypothetical protein
MHFLSKTIIHIPKRRFTGRKQGIASVVRQGIPLLLLLCLNCYTISNRTMADEAYSQNYATGPNRGGSSGSAADAIFGVPAAICTSIDRAKTASRRNRQCKELFRVLNDGNAAAYEWQSYHTRCN